MDHMLIWVGAAVFLFLLLVQKIRKGFFSFLISVCARFVTAGLLMYGINVYFANEGIYIPINEYTLSFSGLLGLPGIAALVFMQKFIM